LLAVLTLGALESVRRTLLRKLGVRFDNKISDHLLSSSIHRAIKKSNSSVGVMRDLSSFRSFLSGSSMFPLLDAPWTPMFILILYLLHPLLGLVGLVGCVLLFSLAILNEYVTRDGVKENGAQAKQQLELARSYVQNADVIQAMGMQRTLISNWNESNARNLADGYKVGRINTRLQTLSKMLKLILLVGVIFVAAWLILKGELTAGATLASMLLLRRAITPLEQSIRSWKSVIKARSSFRNISEYLDHSSSLIENASMPEPSGKLVLEKISFRRSGEERSVISGLNLTLEPGKITIISGESATGKSTLIRLVAGIISPTMGKITLGGYELSQWSAEQLGPHIGYLPQNTSLFPGTVGFNIGRLKEQSIEDIIAAAKLARVHEMIQKLPNGYDTYIEEGGTNLSGGQQQKIGLARALFGNPSIVLLDEPDASLDPDSRSALRKVLRDLRERNVAVLIISHHTSMHKLADIRYQLRNRKLVTDLSQLTQQARKNKKAISSSSAKSLHKETPADASNSAGKNVGEGASKNTGKQKEKETREDNSEGPLMVPAGQLLQNQSQVDTSLRPDKSLIHAIRIKKDQRLRMQNKLKQAVAESRGDIDAD